MPSQPSRLRRQLGIELRAVRELAGLSQRDLSNRTGLTQSMVSRAERGDALLTRDQMNTWLRAAGGDDPERILTLTEAAHRETRSWPDMLGADTHLQDIAAEREAGARQIDELTILMIPGLLQTADYARHVTEQVDPAGRMDHAAMVAARINRQRILFENGPRQFRFLLEQAALEWSPGPDVMPAQLDRLLSLATLPNLELGILLTRRVGALTWHSFTIYTPADDSPPYVTTELRHGGQDISDPDAVQEYVVPLGWLWAAALTGNDALDVCRSTRSRR